MPPLERMTALDLNYTVSSFEYWKAIFLFISKIWQSFLMDVMRHSPFESSYTDVTLWQG